MNRPLLFNCVILGWVWCSSWGKIAKHFRLDLIGTIATTPVPTLETGFLLLLVCSFKLLLVCDFCSWVIWRWRCFEGIWCCPCGSPCIDTYTFELHFLLNVGAKIYGTYPDYVDFACPHPLSEFQLACTSPALNMSICLSHRRLQFAVKSEFKIDINSPL